MIIQYHITTVLHMWYWINRRCFFSSKRIAIVIIIRQSHDHLTLIIHIPILGKMVFILEQPPGSAEKTLPGLFPISGPAGMGKDGLYIETAPRFCREDPIRVVLLSVVQQVWEKMVFILKQHPVSAEKTLSGLFSYQWASRYGPGHRFSDQ